MTTTPHPMRRFDDGMPSFSRAMAQVLERLAAVEAAQAAQAARAAQMAQQIAMLVAQGTMWRVPVVTCGELPFGLTHDYELPA